MGYLTLNNFSTTLSSDLASGAGTAYIPQTDADKFVTAGMDGDCLSPVVLTITNGSDIEIIHCISVAGSGGQIGIERQKEGTTSPANFPAGSTVECRFTAGHLSDTLKYYSVFLTGTTYTIDAARSTSMELVLNDNTTLTYDVPGSGYERAQRHTAIVEAFGGARDLTVAITGNPVQVNAAGVSFPMTIASGKQVLLDVVVTENYAFVNVISGA